MNINKRGWAVIAAPSLICIAAAPFLGHAVRGLFYDHDLGIIANIGTGFAMGILGACLSFGVFLFMDSRQ